MKARQSSQRQWQIAPDREEGGSSVDGRRLWTMPQADIQRRAAPCDCTKPPPKAYSAPKAYGAHCRENSNPWSCCCPRRPGKVFPCLWSLWGLTEPSLCVHEQHSDLFAIQLSQEGLGPLIQGRVEGAGRWRRFVLQSEACRSPGRTTPSTQVAGQTHMPSVQASMPPLNRKPCQQCLVTEAAGACSCVVQRQKPLELVRH